MGSQRSCWRWPELLRLASCLTHKEPFRQGNACQALENCKGLPPKTELLGPLGEGH